jgi:hypothetical protein
MNGNNAFAAICRVLQSLTLFRGTAADWVRWLGARSEDPKETFLLLRRAFLQKDATPATHIFCAACCCRHEVFVWTEDRVAALRSELYPTISSSSSLADTTSDLVAYDARRSDRPRSLKATDSTVQRFNDSTCHDPNRVLAAVCRCDDHPGCPDLQLTPADLEIWALSWPRLARELCRALELAQQFVELAISNTRQIGSWSSAAVPVLLTIQPDRERLRTIILELIARFGRRFIVLAPAARHLDAACLELLEKADAICFPLDACLVLTDNATLRPIRPPGELFGRFAPKLDDSDFSEAQRVFALVQQLDAGARNKLPSVLTVFRLYCIEDLTVDQIADKCRCAKSTVSNRLHQIRKTTGTDPITFRRMSGHFDRMMDQTTDSRARSKYLRLDE